ncbi:hypothetical protein TTY48_33490 [Tsukamurella sp. TY48]|uniref:PE-PPE domain-containing protein n=1 Tax=Tsukamurella sp. TY48 TaxID=2775495 RepID=UPI001C7DB799|nr:PE-PPE domain-containing protein [Tsukamurella sp. TY48]GIZ98737.1 hypothetical protein TTY48_33490 [Tsukamurella sp. TY48]
MTSRHRRPTSSASLAAVGTGLVGAFLLATPTSGFLAQALAKTIVVVGGANDPTGQDQWKRIGRDHTGAPPVLVPYSAQFGIGWPGFALSPDRTTTYAQSVDEGADATVKAVADAAASDDEVVVYTISQGSDVVGLAVIRYGKDHPAPTGGGTPKLTFVEQGGPSFIRTGMWNVIPAGIPGLHNGPIRNDGASGASVVGICIRGDIACGVGNPISTVFYAFPGFMLHGTGYTSEYIGRYSPVDGGEPYTPGSKGEVPVKVEQVHRDGRTVIESTYADGSTKRTWVEDNATWVVIDTGENPWMRLLRANGTPIPREFDRLLNTLIPIAEPGARNPFLLPESPSPTRADSPSKPDTAGRHSIDRPGTVSVAELMTKAGAEAETPTAVTAQPSPASGAHETAPEPPGPANAPTSSDPEDGVPEPSGPDPDSAPTPVSAPAPDSTAVATSDAPTGSEAAAPDVAAA